MTIRIETPIIAILVAGLFFTGIFTIFTGLAAEYGESMDMSPFTTHNQSTSLQDGLNRINETKTQMDELSEDFYTKKLIGGEQGGLFTFLQMGYATGKAIYYNLFIFKDLVQVMSEILGIPGVVVATLMTILIFIFVVTVILLLLGRTYAQ